MTKDKYKRTAELLTELRWHVATFTSFIPDGSKERKPFDAKLRDLERLRLACESEAMKCNQS